MLEAVDTIKDFKNFLSSTNWKPIQLLKHCAANFPQTVISIMFSKTAPILRCYSKFSLNDIKAWVTTVWSLQSRKRHKWLNSLSNRHLLATKPICARSNLIPKLKICLFRGSTAFFNKFLLKWSTKAISIPDQHVIIRIQLGIQLGQSKKQATCRVGTSRK